MKTKLNKLLSEKASDMGLSKRAIEQYVEIAAEGLAEDATDDDVAQAVENILPYLKVTQGEVTRKNKPKPSTTPKPKDAEEEEGKTKDGDAEQMPQWAKAFSERLDKLTAENEALKADKARSERTAQIAAKAKELGIPDFLMKRYHLADDADIDKELAEYKQELVNNSLMGKGQAQEVGTSAEAMKASAMAWAKTLPDKQA